MVVGRGEDEPSLRRAPLARSPGDGDGGGGPCSALGVGDCRSASSRASLVEWNGAWADQAMRAVCCGRDRPADRALGARRARRDPRVAVLSHMAGEAWYAGEARRSIRVAVGGLTFDVGRLMKKVTVSGQTRSALQCLEQSLAMPPRLQTSSVRGEYTSPVREPQLGEKFGRRETNNDSALTRRWNGSRRDGSAVVGAKTASGRRAFGTCRCVGCSRV